MLNEAPTIEISKPAIFEVLYAELFTALAAKFDSSTNLYGGEDVAQEAFLSLFATNHYNEYTFLQQKKFLFTTAERKYIDIIRKNTFEEKAWWLVSHSATLEQEAGYNLLEDSFLTNESKLIFFNTFFSDLVMDQHREILLLKYVRELSLKELAIKYNINENSVKDRLDRAKKAVVKQLIQQGLIDKDSVNRILDEDVSPTDDTFTSIDTLTLLPEWAQHLLQDTYVHGLTPSQIAEKSAGLTNKQIISKLQRAKRLALNIHAKINRDAQRQQEEMLYYNNVKEHFFDNLKPEYQEIFEARFGLQLGPKEIAAQSNGKFTERYIVDQLSNIKRRIETLRKLKMRNKL